MAALPSNWPEVVQGTRVPSQRGPQPPSSHRSQQPVAPLSSRDFTQRLADCLEGLRFNEFKQSKLAVAKSAAEEKPKRQFPSPPCGW